MDLSGTPQVRNNSSLLPSADSLPRSMSVTSTQSGPVTKSNPLPIPAARPQPAQPGMNVQSACFMARSLSLFFWSPTSASVETAPHHSNTASLFSPASASSPMTSSPVDNGSASAAASTAATTNSTATAAAAPDPSPSPTDPDAGTGEDSTHSGVNTAPSEDIHTLNAREVERHGKYKIGSFLASGVCFACVWVCECCFALHSFGFVWEQVHTGTCTAPQRSQPGAKWP